MHLDTIIVALIGFVAITAQSYLHYRERKDLYSRIQAGSLREYQEGTGQKPSSNYPKGNPIKKTLDKQYDLRER
jgi:hypothetical protein